MNIDKNIFTKVFDIKKRYSNNENIDDATLTVMNDIMDLFDIDRIYISAKSPVKNKCVPIAEYFLGGEVNFFGDVVDFTGFAKFVNITVEDEEQSFMDLLDKSEYFKNDSCNELHSNLSKLGYYEDSRGLPSESLVLYIKNIDTFSFLCMERWNKENELSEAEQMALSDIHDMMKMRLERDRLRNNMQNEMYIKNILVENEYIPICIVDKKDKIVIYYNDYYKQFIPKVFVGVKYDDLFAENQLFDGKRNNAELLADTETLVHHKYKLNEEEFTTYWIKKVKSIVLADGTEAFMIYIKDTLEYIKQLEGIDLLTSAYSMKGFVANFENSIKKNRVNNDDKYIVCSLDVAKFKHINDAKGFSFGNKLLKKIAGVLSKFLEPYEMFCRMSEDKFAILFKYVDEKDKKERVEALFDELETMRKECFSDISINYVCGVVDIDFDADFINLLDKANMTRKSCKGSLNNTIAFFDEDMERKLNTETDIEARIDSAIENDEFTAYLQPKFNLKTMKICGAEALVRWITPTGMIYPDAFIPLFERNGFITTLDFIIYRKVMKYIRECLDKNITVYPISLNVSRNHIQNENFVAQVQELVDEYKIPTELLELEITESVFVEDTEVLKLFVDKIKTTNIKVSIDDFGAAYSSLQTLKDINIDILKIDKGFLDNITFDDKTIFTKDILVLKNIIYLAEDLNYKVICEGIETQEQVEILRNIGCECGQGYVFARPMPIADYEKEYLID